MAIDPPLEVALGHVVALVAAGMGVAFFVADWRSTTSRVLAAFLALLGVSIWTSVAFQQYRSPDEVPIWVRLSGVPVAITVMLVAEWLLRIRRTIPAANLNTRFGDLALRVAQAAGTVYGVATIVFWRERAEWLIFRLGTPSGMAEGAFLIFGVPFFTAIALVGWVAILTLNRKPDRAERVRLVALALAVPFLASGFVVRGELAAYGTVIGLMIFLVGALEYHVVQGERGQFMARFLAPQVAELVRTQGLERAIRDEKCEISAVYCDVRGFTRFAEREPTEKVIDLLRKYYDVVGKAATEVGGTIKDYAGDGVLVLIGAPLTVPDRAARALRLAETLVRDTEAVLREASEPAESRPSASGPGSDLGVGIGIASGPVSVGIVGGTRLEYVAVGSTVNLAARLCQMARPGQILIDRETRSLLGDDRRVTEESHVTLKGFSEPIPVYGFA